MVGRIHIYHPHIQGLVYFFHYPDSLGRRLFRITDYTCMAVKKSGHRSPRSAVFRSCHRMCCNILPSLRMVLHTSGKVFFCRTDVNHHLVRNHIKNPRKHPYSGSYRHSQYDNIGFRYAILQSDHPVNYAYLFGCSRIHRFRLHTQHLFRETSSLEIYRHRASYQAQSYYSYLHITEQYKTLSFNHLLPNPAVPAMQGCQLIYCYSATCIALRIFSAALFRTSGFAQSEIRM